MLPPVAATFAHAGDAAAIGDDCREFRAESAGRFGHRGRRRKALALRATKCVPTVVNDVPHFFGQVDDLVDDRVRIVAG